MDTSILDKMFPEISPRDDQLDICNKVIFALRAVGQDWEEGAWRELAELVKDNDEFAGWSDHFLRVADGVGRKNRASTSRRHIE